MLRTSSYTIYVDLPDNSEQMLLVHGYTGAYDKVSRRVATYIRSLEVKRPPKPLYGEWTPEPSVDGQVIPPSEKTIEVLKRRGYLTEKSQEEEEEIFTKFSDDIHERNLRKMPTYIVMPTYSCNLRCAYCFQDYMRTNPKFSHLLRVMQPEVVDRMFLAMVELEAMSGFGPEEPHHRDIGFFGGEPLLEASRPTVQYIIEQALEKGTASFWAISNGTELDAYRDLLAPNKIARLQITIDGPPDEHDRRRIYADGSGSYERIARNIDMSLDQGVRILIRLNLDRRNIERLPELTEDFIRRGWDRHELFSVYAAPVRAENENVDHKDTFNTWELDQALVELAQKHEEVKLVGRPDDSLRSQAFQVFRSSAGPMTNFRESFCSAHTGMFIFDAFQDIYACWDRTGDPTIRLGHVGSDGKVTLDREIQQLWRGRTVTSNPVCRKCRYALHCGGGCAILAYNKTGRLHSNFCDDFASRFRANLAEAYQTHISRGELSIKGERLTDQ